MQIILDDFFKTAVPKLRLDEGRVLGCEYGHYPWDDWERRAVADGLDRDLAALGRLTIREAYEHQWDDRLKSLCGWRDDGRRMLRFALRSPEKAKTAVEPASGNGRISRRVPMRKPGSGFRIIELMPWRIPEAEIERVKRETDLVALVQSRGVELKKHG